jgi:protein gp37
MSANSSIEWTSATWTPVKGCSRASAGCDNCYAVTMTHRLEAMGQKKYAGLTVLNKRGQRHFNGVVRCDYEALTAPLRWKKPTKIFVSSMSDMFHKDVPFEFIDRVFAVMALCPQHTFQMLTKRPERMAEYLASKRQTRALVGSSILDVPGRWGGHHHPIEMRGWPLPNVWLGTSVEDQAAADDRIPHLLRCPAAVSFLSLEPLIGPVDLSRLIYCQACNGNGHVGGGIDFETGCGAPGDYCPQNCQGRAFIDWIIVGGESGPRARPVNLEWIRSIVQQCKAAGVSCFVKQLGAHPYDTSFSDQFLNRRMTVKTEADLHRAAAALGTYIDNLDWLQLRDRKGGDMAEWPEDLRVREFPQGMTATKELANA